MIEFAICDFLIYMEATGGPFTNFNDGGVRQRFIFYTQKNHNFRICLPKKSLLFLAYPKKSLSPFFATQKYPSGFFSRPQKIPASFIDPKKSLLAKLSDPKNHSGLPSLKFVSGAPGMYILNTASFNLLKTN